MDNAVREVAAEQLADAVRNLREERVTDPVTAVHEARKDLKKTRSVLRLVRGGMPSEARRATNDALREIAAGLAGVRDADVMAQTAGKLHERFAGQVPARAFTTVKRRFATQAARSRDAADGLISEDVVGALQGQLADVKHWPLADLDRDALAAGVAEAYGHGREEFLACRRNQRRGLHEWRKRVKDLWYHAKLSNTFPAMWLALGDAAHDLSDLLGDDHDLGVLAGRIGGRPWPCRRRGPLRRLLPRAAGAGAPAGRLRARCPAGAEKPKAFARRARAYLTVSPLSTIATSAIRPYAQIPPTMRPRFWPARSGVRLASRPRSRRGA